MNHHIFRENDIRGLVDTDLTPLVVDILASAIGTYFLRNKVRCVCLGRDVRASSIVFRDIFVRGLNQTGLDVLDLGEVPTPILYFALFTENTDAGVMITGSHNPEDHNGFKLCLGTSALRAAELQEIKQIAMSGNFTHGEGKTYRKNILPNYINFVSKNIKLGKRKLKVVVDAGNGIAGIAGIPIYKQLGCKTVELFVAPDSSFPNHHPDPTIVENMQSAIETVKETGANLAIVFDGDGDRIGIVDEKGNVISSDNLMIIFARSILKKLPEATFIAEVKCSQHLFDDIKRLGGKAIMWKVGHSVIKAKMRETGAVLAGEMSGHMFFADRFYGFDDAIYSGARLLEILSNTNKSLSELLKDLPPIYNTPEIRLDCPDESKFEIVRQLSEELKKTNPVIDIDGARVLFENGWGLVRASNTQPVLVMRFEAVDEKSLKNIQKTVEMKVRNLMRAARISRQ